MAWRYPSSYEVIVIGGGHAGCEAAYAAAKMGCRTLLLTMNPYTIAQMSCNPSIGGIAKGHIVREIDALGGLMGKAIDRTGIQFRMLNTKRGPAVQSPRGQADKEAYKQWMKQTLENTPSLEIKQGTCEEIVVSDGAIRGVISREGIFFEAPTVIITTGTFMQGLIHIGDVNFPGGRCGEPPSVGLSKSLEQNGIRLGRLKTGTPVRVHKRSIDFSLAEPQPGDDWVYFSYDEKAPRLPQVPCHIVYTTKETKEIILKNLHRSPLYSGKIKGIGPRYCPSIEDKTVRFSDKDRHQVFLEPEGLHTEEIYTSGISSSLPFDVQYEIVRSIPALKNAEIIRSGYAIEYDYVVSGQISFSLESKLISGLFFAGQVNGTTGYEEAGGQGLLAAINAVQKLKNQPPLILSRDTSYIGVMIDDLITKGVDEPYRMFTSRAEHRLLLRQDNADLRLRHHGYTVGLISQEQYDRLLAKQQVIATEPKRLASIHKTFNGKSCSLIQLLARPEISYKDLLTLFPDVVHDFGDDTNTQIEVSLKYEGYISRQVAEVERLSTIETILLPEDFDFQGVTGLRTEAKLRLSKTRPCNLGQASRIPGIAPADISVLMIALKRMPCATEHT
jgi:tRNA uridine 5-carboxymethylaminomethyl modification enzyme